MRQPEKRVIDGVHFECTPLGFAASRKAFVRLTKIAGPALASGGGANTAEVFAVLSERVSDEDLEWFADLFGATTRFSHDGDAWPFLKADNREVLFGGGRLGLFFQWLMFALEVNYSDFFEWLRSAATESDLPAQTDPKGD